MFFLYLVCLHQGINSHIGKCCIQDHVMGPPCKAPGPLRSAGVPPGLASNPNEFGNAFQNFFLAEKRIEAYAMLHMSCFTVTSCCA